MKSIKNADLTERSTFKLNSKAKELIEINQESDLLAIDNFDNVHILGGGSNSIFPPFFDKTILQINIKGIEIISEDKDEVILKVGAGENWHNFIKYCVENNYFGFENLALIPGNVGAAPIQNIGAYGVEQEERFLDLEYFDLESKKIEILKKEECDFGYRDSIFKRKLKSKAIICSVKYKLSKLPNINISYGDLIKYFDGKKEITPKEVFEAVVEIRTKKLPSLDVFPNCGSFFKNPVVDKAKVDSLLSKYQELKYFEFQDRYKIPAAWLIDRSNLKSLQIGGAKISEKHALVLGNHENASYDDVVNLKKRVIDTVVAEFGIILEPEVNLLTN